jgi:hypothetical protein
LVEFFQEKGVDVSIVSPYEARYCSLLLKHTDVPIYYIVDQESVLSAENEKPPMSTDAHKGLFRMDYSYYTKHVKISKRVMKGNIKQMDY